MMPDDAVDRRELGEMKRDKISIQIITTIDSHSDSCVCSLKDDRNVSPDLITVALFYLKCLLFYRTQTKKLHTYQRVKNTKNKLQSTFMMHKIGSHFVHFVDKMARSSHANDHFKQFGISLLQVRWKSARLRPPY